MSPGAVMDTVKPSGVVLRAGTRATSFLIDRLPELVILLASTLALGTWYGGESLVWGEDATHPMSLGEISTYFHLPDAGLGAPDARKVPFVLPVGAALAAWRELGIPYDLVVLQPIVVVGLLTAAGWSSMLLVRKLLPSVGKTAALAAALFYMFNPYSLTTIWSSMSYLSFHYAFLPLVLTSWFLVLTRRVSWWFVPPTAALWALTLTPAYITTPVAVTDTALFGAVAVFAALTGSGRAAAGTLGRGALLYGIWLALNVFWIVPLATFAGAETTRGLAAGDPQELFAQNSAPFVEAIRLAGYWGVSSSYAGSPYFAWYRYFAEIGSRVAFAFPLLAIVAVVAVARSRTELRGRRGRESPDARSFFIFFVVLLLSALTLMAGVHEPFGWLKERVVETFGLVGPFRSVYQRFGVYVAVAYVPVVAVGIWILQRTVRERVGAVAAVVATAGAAAAVAVLPALPLWTGSAFGSSGFIPSRRITVPTDYLRLAPVLDKDRQDFNVLVLPYGGSGASVLNWEDRQAGYVGIEPLSLLTRKPVLTFDATTPYLEPLAWQVANGGKDAAQALQLLNARVVVIHNDADYDYLVNRLGVIGLDVTAIDDRLELLPQFRLLYAGPNLRAYTLETWRPYRFFAARPTTSSFRNRARRTGSVDLSDRSAFSAIVERRPLPYRVEGVGRFTVDTSSLRPGELLVMNQPFERTWRAGALRPVALDPGLTAFEVGQHDKLAVTNTLEERFAWLLVTLPVTLLGCAASLGIGLERRRRTGRNP